MLNWHLTIQHLTLTMIFLDSLKVLYKMSKEIQMRFSFKALETASVRECTCSFL